MKLANGLTAVWMLAGAVTASAWAGPLQSQGALARPEAAPDADAEGTVGLRLTASGRTLDLRMTGLDPRASFALRLDQGDRPVVKAFRTDRKGRARFSFRGRLPGGAYEPIANRPIDVVTYANRTPGDRLLAGRVPIVSGFPYWTEPGGGTDGGTGGGSGSGGTGTGGGGTTATTRLVGVDGDGPLAVASATFSLPTAAGGLAPGSTVVWYPGTGGTVTTSTSATSGGPYPPIVLVHAFQLGSGDYQDWAKKIASWGFVVAVPGHADPLLVADNEKEVKTTLGVMDWLVAQNADATSRFFGALDVQKFGFVGHSLGGGAALVASTRAATQGRVKAVVGLAPATLSTSSGLFGGSTPILPDTTTGNWPATLVVTGSQDTIVAPALSRSTYFAPAPTPRAFVRLDRHCHMNYADNIPAIASLGSDYDANTCTTPAAQLKEARIYVIPWLLRHLRGDLRVTDYTDGTYASEQANVAERTFE